MISVPFPDDEALRLVALRALEILDSPPEAEFDALVKAASLVCHVPISLISLVDSERQWFKANIGLPGVQETPRDIAFCSHAILDNRLFEVSDATQDPCFADNPLVAGQPDIRFYAGMPLQLSNGYRVGTLCVIDREPRQLDETQREVLRCLGQAAVAALEARHVLRLHQQAIAENYASEARFRTLCDYSPHGVFYTDSHGSCTYTNQRWQEIYGLTFEQSLGQGWAEGVHPDDRTAVLNLWQNTAPGQDEAEMEFRIRRGDNTVRTVCARAHAVKNAAHQIIGYVGSVEDISDRKAMMLHLADKQAHLQRLYEATPAMLHSIDTEGSLCSVSDLWLLKMGYTRGEVIGRPSSDFLTPYSRDYANQIVLPIFFKAGHCENIEYQMVTKTGKIIDVLLSAILEHDEQGRPLRSVAVIEDITLRRRVERELAKEHELLRVTLQSIGDAVITTDGSGHISWLNPAAERMTGWLSEEAEGRPLNHVFNIVNEATRQPTENPVALCLQERKIVGLANHTLLISRDGHEYGIEDSAAPIRNEQGDLLGVVLVFHDVTEQRRLSGEMSYRATHDSLTGLINRGEFEARLRRVLQQAHDDKTVHALMYIDLDQFKLVNDACGHAIGDQLLQQVSKLFGTTIRARDTLARLGGDEFAIILEHCPMQQAQRVAQQICERMEDFRFTHDERRFRIGASIGLVPIDNHWGNTTLILQAADTSCYAAKEAGRNRVHVWFDTDQAMRARHGEMQWTGRIEQALDENRFVLFAQRIICLHDNNQVLNAEVLLRMLDKDGSLVLPEAFLPAAERFHLASRIDRWVLQHVIAWMKNTLEHDANAIPGTILITTLNVNLSGQSIGDRAFHRWAHEVLQEAGADICSRLAFEITETAAITNMADAVLFIDQVRAQGVKIALDDFGAGAASFGYLKNLPLDSLKIDGQFIRDVVDDPLDEAAVRCFVDVAKVINVKTVAEFVDKEAILDKIKIIGVDYAQGFLLHRPAPINELLTAQVEDIENLHH